MSEKKDGIDKFFDILDKGAEKFVGVMQGVHYPGKEDEPDAQDAEFRDVPTLRASVIGAETLTDKRGHYWHIFQKEGDVYPYCAKPTRVVAWKKPSKETGFYAVCVQCLFRVIAFQTQSEDVAVKELTDGR